MLALLLLGCVGSTPSAPVLTSAPIATVAPTVGPPGQLHLTMDPPYDCCDLQLRYILADGSTVGGEKVRGDIEVIVNRPFDPGTVQVKYNDVTCEGVVEIASGMESDAVMDIGAQPARCSLRTTETHPTGSIEHPDLPLTAHVGAFMPFGVPSVFVLQSLDNPDAPPTATIPVDRAPWEVMQVEVTPGLYQLSVLVDGEVLGSLREDIVRGSDWIFPLRILPRDVPRDCGEIPAAQCERAITAAYDGGLFLQGDTRVTAVSVRPTIYGATACDSGIVPEFDLTFQLANPKGESGVTVGTPPNGRLTACTY